MKKKIVIGIVIGLAIPLFFIVTFLRTNDQIEVIPDVQFPLKEYRMTDSRVPGFPLLVTAEGADKIHVSVKEGDLLLWNPPDNNVYNKGQELEIESGDQIYWSPLQVRWDAPSDSDKDDNLKGSNITLVAYHNNKQVGTTVIELNVDKDGMYTGKLKAQE